MRHLESLKYQATFMNSGAYRFTRGSNRAGRIKIHWAESSRAEATSRLEHLQSDAAPAHGDAHHSFYQIPALDQVRISHGFQGIVWMDNTIMHRKVGQAAQDRRQWAILINKPAVGADGLRQLALRFQKKAKRGPWLARLIAAMIRAERPGVEFSAFSIDQHLKIGMGRDVTNLKGTFSAVVGLNEFHGGQISVEDPQGTIEKDIPMDKRVMNGPTRGDESQDRGVREIRDLRRLEAALR